MVRLGFDELLAWDLGVGVFHLAGAGAAAAAEFGAAGLDADVATLDLRMDERGDEEDSQAAAAQQREGEAAQPSGEVSCQRLEGREEDRLEPGSKQAGGKLLRFEPARHEAPPGR